MFSVKISKYIDNASLLPKYDYDERIKSKVSIEEIIGIQQELSPNLCIKLLSKDGKNRISIEELKQLNIVEILGNYTPTDEEKEKLYLLNENLVWRQLNELFISTDEQFQIEPSQHLHEDFYPIRKNFGVPELSENTLALKINPETVTAKDEIKMAFSSKAKYIAFKIDQSNYPEIESELIEKINQYDLYEVDSIEKVFPEDNPIYRTEFDFYHSTNENKIFYTGYWKTNSDVIDFLFSLIEHENIKKVWFDNVINRWDNDKIIEMLEGEFGETSWSRNNKDNKTSKSTIFLDEIDSILDNEKIKSKLKQKALDIGGNLEEKDQYNQNLVAKIALLKHLDKEELIEEIDLDDYNNLRIEGKEYKVYSSKGEFAHIQSSALLQLKNEQCKVAVYYGAKNGVKIFSSIEGLFELNDSYIFEYQAKGDIEKLLEFLENNNIESYRYLLINPNIRKQYISIDNRDSEINQEASNLI